MRPLLFSLLLVTCHLPLAGAARPNILFAISDDQSFPHASAYGTTWVKTPAFDRVAREGLLFNRAYTPNAKCAPSRSCILTGRNSWQLEEAANHFPNFPAKFTTYPEALERNGYHVGKTGKGWAPGNMGRHPDGTSRQLPGRGYDKRKATPPAKHISNNDYAANFVDFLDAKPGDAPFCFWYGSTEPHRAFEFKAGTTKGGKKPADIGEVPAFWPDNETVRHDMLDYAFEIEHFDAHLGRMLQTLEQRGLLENTLVVVTADNGMAFPRIKGQEYEMSNHLPFAAMWPAGIRNPGREIDDYISFIDLAPTFLEIAGLTFGAASMHPSPGRSLTDIFNSEKAGQVVADRDHVLIGKERHDIGRPNDWGYPIRGIVRNDTLYLRNFEPKRWPAGNPETGYLNTDGSPTKSVILDLRRSGENPAFWQSNFGLRPTEELYHVKSDPYCVKNTAGDPDQAEAKDALEQELLARLRAQGDPRIVADGTIFDNYPYSDRRTVNFHQRFTAGEKLRAGWVNPTDFEKAPLD